ncbi:MAG: hypothetical protein NVS3B6_14270 [Pseudarthrobacter sp.]
MTPSTVARTSGVLPRFTLFCAGSFNITEFTAELVAVVTVMTKPSIFIDGRPTERPDQANRPACGMTVYVYICLHKTLFHLNVYVYTPFHEVADVAAVTVRSKTKESHSEHPHGNCSATRY